MSTNLKLIITFIRLEENCPFESFYLLGQNHKIEKTIDELTIDIPENIFELDKEKKIIDFQLFPKDINCQTYTYRFHVYYGVNKAYLFLLKYTQILYEICFKEQEKVVYDNIILDKIDSFDNDSRRRMIIINAPFQTKIEGCRKYIYEYISAKLRGPNETSYQVSIFDSSNSYVAAKIIKKEIDFSVISNIKNDKTSLEKFHKELN